MLQFELLQRLRGVRLIGRNLEPRHGVGERRSRGVGAGVEFADYREYQPGDDFRYLDRHVYARHGRKVLRQYHIEQQITVNILYDNSASMRMGEPAKGTLARQLVAALATIALNGGDLVDVARLDATGVTWHPRLSKFGALPRLFEWLQSAVPEGEIDLDSISRSTRERMLPGNLLLLVSDWLLDDIEPALARWRHRGLEIIALQVLAAEERDPSGLGSGPLQLIDAERGDFLEVDLDSSAIQRYRAAFETHQRDLQAQIVAVQGRYLSVASDERVEDVVMRRMRQQGVIR